MARRFKKAPKGNLGEVKSIRDEVFEMREHFDPRLADVFRATWYVLIVMPGGGDKSAQAAYIARTVKMAASFEDCAMTKKVKVSDLPEFDLTEHLESEQAIAEYITTTLAENDQFALANGLGSIARARGMTDIAKASGITREALYKALRPNASLRFETVSKVCAALGVRLIAQPIRT